jgi:hypothetical protein
VATFTLWLFGVAMKAMAHIDDLPKIIIDDLPIIVYLYIYRRLFTNYLHDY